MRRKRFAVQLSTGLADVGKVKSAIMFATIAQCSGCDTVVFCVQDGVDAIIKGKIKESIEAEGHEIIHRKRLTDGSYSVLVRKC